MARRRPRPSSPPPQPQHTPSQSGGGILSGVLSFVSREFESFVASATGVPRAHDDVVYEEEYTDDEEEDEDERRRRRRRRKDRSPPRKRSRHGRSQSRKRSPPPDSPPPKARSASQSRSHKRRRRRSPSESDQESSSSGTQSPEPASAPAPAPLLRALKRRPSITMPGSLFPRSPSMEPDSRPARDQHVRFTPSHLPPSHSPSPPTPPPDSYQGSDVPLDPQASSPESPSTPSRRRTSVQDAAGRFYVGADDAGPSILLPSPHTSPAARGTTTYTAAEKGKARAIESHDADTSGVLRVQGKEQELVAARQELDRHQRLLDHDDDDQGETSFLQQVERDWDRDKARIRMLEEEIARLKQELSKRPTTSTTDRPYPPPPPPPPPPPVLPLPRKNLIRMPTASDDPNLFASARASLKQAPPPVENPINPIIPARRAGIATVGLAPDKMAAFLNEMKTVRLRKTNSNSAMASSARAHENGNATFVAPTPPSRVMQLAPRRSLEGLHQRRPLMDEDAPMAPEEWAALRARVRAEMDNDARVGEKRKRVNDARAPAEETTSGAAKRVSAAARPSAIAATTSASANSSFGSTSTATSTSSVPRGLPRRKSTPLAQPTSSQSRSQTVLSQPRAQVHPEPQEYTLPPSPPSPPPSARPAPPAIWQASSVTSAPTPSLCSDNDDVHNDAEHAKQDASDDQVPATPPIGVGVLGGSGPSRSFFRFKGNGVPVEEAELGDRSMRLGRSFTRDADADESFVGNVDRDRDLDASMRRSARGVDVPAHEAMDVGGKSGSAKPKAKTRPLASGIPRLKVRRAPTPPARTPPPAHEDEQGQEQDHNMEEQQHRTEHENEDEEDRPSTFIRPRGAAPRANISFLAARPPTSPMPAKSPRRPRAPGRISSRGSASGAAGAGSSASVSAGPPGHTPGVRRVPTSARYEYEDEEYMDEEGGRQGGQGSGLLPSPPLHERTRTPTSGSSRQPASHPHAASAGPSQTQSQSSQKQKKQPKQSKGKGKAKAITPEQAMPAQAKPKTKLKRRPTLDEELRTAVPFLHEDDDNEEEGNEDAHVDPADAYMVEVAQQDADEVPQEEGEREEEDLDSGVLVGVGTRSKRRGFLAHGGAGGPPVFMGVGYVEGAEEDEEQEQEDGPGYAEEEEEEEEEYDDDHGDGDDGDEYLPSPELRARHGGGQRRR